MQQQDQPQHGQTRRKGFHERVFQDCRNEKVSRNRAKDRLGTGPNNGGRGDQQGDQRQRRKHAAGEPKVQD
jgi:hypothetical protein